MSRNASTHLRALTSALATAGLLAAVPSAHGLNKYLKTWEDYYSTAGACSVCHGTSTSNLNAYGAELCLQFAGTAPSDITLDLDAIESLNSDLDPTGSNNWEEIQARAQPGWTEGPINQIYDADLDGCVPIGEPVSVVAGVPLPFDPPVGGMPVADPDGPYAGYVDIPITFDGSGSYDSDETNVIVSYAWSFGDGTEGSGETLEHSYTLPGTYIVTLTVTDDEGDANTNSTIATISGDEVLDLDIAALKVTKGTSVGKPISIQLTVENPGTVQGQALATVKGTQEELPVYEWSLNVYDDSGKGTTSFSFPSYVPTESGSIHWAASIKDVDPDDDLATAVTTVK